MKMLGCCTVSLLAVFLNAYHITHASEIPPPASFACFLCCLEVLRVFTQPFSCYVSLVFLVSDSQQEGDVVIECWPNSNSTLCTFYIFRLCFQHMKHKQDFCNRVA